MELARLLPTLRSLCVNANASAARALLSFNPRVPGMRDSEFDSQPSDEPKQAAPPDQLEQLAPALERNIDAIVRRRAQEARNAGLEERIADRVSRFIGSLPFVYLHVALFGLWIAVNVGWIPLLQPWDPSLVILAMAASVEAIFLSTFVLINQNRMAAADDRRADLNLQISLLNEHETTRLITLVSAIADRLDVSTAVDEEVEELQKDVAPEAVLDHIQRSAGED
jgi:uncharacterized membrane protein